MKVITASILVLLVGAGVLAVLDRPGNAEDGNSPTNAPSWKSFDEGIALAMKENKKILIDVYTDWCGWCKKMDREVYADAKVMAILKTKFIVMKLNAESDEQITYNGEKLSKARFAQAVGVTGYPATLFLQPDAKPITLLPGYVEAKRFASILTFVGDDHYTTISFQDYLRKSGSSN